MAHRLRSITITDDTGTRYTDLFLDIPLNEYELRTSGHGVTGIDAIVHARPFAPRATESGPLGALILRWAQAHVDNHNLLGWQYIDAHDIHTIALADTLTREVHFINLFGHVIGGRRAYRLRELADALDLLLEFEIE
ncbi:hypothetical protein ACPW96_21565 [Micromonospora sp. DT81.3]|uniref:hypothetical protein n=1 Tax=Micromonospora sp. DT81.3 TaxID=3416523 RepID=UPI003CFB4082